MLNRDSEGEHPYLASDLWGKSFKLLPLNIMLGKKITLATEFLVGTLLKLRLLIPVR